MRSQAILSLAAAMALGCGASENPNPDFGPIVDLAAPRTGALLVVHAVADAPDVDVYLSEGGKPALTVKYGQAQRSNVPSGIYTLELRKAGDDPGWPALLTRSLTVEPDSRTVLVAYGRTASVQIAAAPAGLVDPKALKLRVLHASPAAPTTVALTIAGVAAGDAPALGRASFGQPTDYAALAADIADKTKLTLRAGAPAADLASLSLPALTRGAVYSAVLFGDSAPLAGDRFLSVALVNEGDGSVTLRPVDVSRQGNAQVVVQNSAAGVGDVSFGLKDAPNPLVSRLSYPLATRLFTFTAGEATLDVKPGMGSNFPATQPLGRFLPGLAWTLVFAGQSGGKDALAPQVRAYPRLSAPDQGLGSINLRLIHAGPDTPAVDVLADKMALFSGVAYGQVGAPRTLLLDAGLKGLLSGAGLTVNTAGSATRLFTIKVPADKLSKLDGNAVSVLISGLSTDMNNKRSARAVLENLASTNNFAEVVDLTLAP